MPIAPRGISILLTFMFAHNGSPVDEPTGDGCSSTPLTLHQTTAVIANNLLSGIPNCGRTSANRRSLHLTQVIVLLCRRVRLDRPFPTHPYAESARTSPSRATGRSNNPRGGFIHHVKLRSDRNLVEKLLRTATSRSSAVPHACVGRQPARSHRHHQGHPGTLQQSRCSFDQWHLS
jgi:hypothetical protein